MSVYHVVDEWQFVCIDVLIFLFGQVGGLSQPYWQHDMQVLLLLLSDLCHQQQSQFHRLSNGFRYKDSYCDLLDII